MYMVYAIKCKCYCDQFVCWLCASASIQVTECLRLLNVKYNYVSIHAYANY